MLLVTTPAIYETKISPDLLGETDTLIAIAFGKNKNEENMNMCICKGER